MGCHDVPYEVLCFSTKKFRRGTLPISEKSWIRNMLWIKEGHGTTILSPKKYCLTALKSFTGEPFNVSEYFWYQKLLWLRLLGRQGCHDLPSIFFRLTVSETFVGGTFLVWEKLWHRKISWIKGWCITFSRREICVSQCQKVSWGNPWMFPKNSGIKKFYG